MGQSYSWEGVYNLSYSWISTPYTFGDHLISISYLAIKMFSVFQHLSFLVIIWFPSPILLLNCFFSLRRGDLISRSCLFVIMSVCLYVLMYVHMSVCYSFLIFQKRGFESANSNLSNTTKLTLHDLLLQEFTAEKFQIATCLIWPSLYCLIHFYKSLRLNCSVEAGDNLKL